jgi:hypothetical protein
VTTVRMPLRRNEGQAAIIPHARAGGHRAR